MFNQQNYKIESSQESLSTNYLNQFSLDDHVHKDKDNNRFYRFKATTDDSLKYTGQIFLPGDHEQNFHHTIVYTTPWLTDLDGFNTNIGLEFARNGFKAISLSPEHPGLPEAVNHFKNVLFNNQDNLSRDAHSYHQILNHFNEFKSVENLTIDSSNVILFGYSRGSMVGLGINALAKMYNRKIVYNEFIDLCLEHSVRNMNIKPQTIFPNLIEEALSGLKELGHMNRQELSHVLQTLPPNIPSFLEQITTGISLFRGETGKFIQDIPPDQNITSVTFFENSLFNQQKEWEYILKDSLKYIHIEKMKGYHLTGMNKEVLSRSIARLILFEKLQENNFSLEETHLKLFAA